MIGRMVKGGHRELVIGQGSHGTVALYRFVPSIDTVFVLTIRRCLQYYASRNTLIA